MQTITLRGTTFSSDDVSGERRDSAAALARQPQNQEPTAVVVGAPASPTPAPQRASEVVELARFTDTSMSAEGRAQDKGVPTFKDPRAADPLLFDYKLSVEQRAAVKSFALSVTSDAVTAMAVELFLLKTITDPRRGRFAIAPPPSSGRWLAAERLLAFPVQGKLYRFKQKLRAFLGLAAPQPYKPSLTVLKQHWSYRGEMDAQQYIDSARCGYMTRVEQIQCGVPYWGIYLHNKGLNSSDPDAEAVFAALTTALRLPPRGLPHDFSYGLEAYGRFPLEKTWPLLRELLGGPHHVAVVSLLSAYAKKGGECVALIAQDRELHSMLVNDVGIALNNAPEERTPEYWRAMASLHLTAVLGGAVFYDMARSFLRHRYLTQPFLGCVRELEEKILSVAVIHAGVEDLDLLHRLERHIGSNRGEGGFRGLLGKHLYNLEKKSRAEQTERQIDT